MNHIPVPFAPTDKHKHTRTHIWKVNKPVQTNQHDRQVSGNRGQILAAWIPLNDVVKIQPFVCVCVYVREGEGKSQYLTSIH